MKRLIPILFLVSFTTLAQNEGVRVQIIDQNIDSSTLERSYQVRRTQDTQSSIPDRDLREEVLEGVKAVEKWDELKKDIFFMDLKSKSLKELVKKYPEMKESELRFLKDKR